MVIEEGYRHWKESTFGSEWIIWHDGLDVSGVQSLTGEARDSTLSMLAKGLGVGDSHAAQALAAMGHASSIPQLQAQLAESSSKNKVAIALAIHALSPDESLARALVEVLEDTSLHWGDRIDAAIGLRKFRDLMSERALLHAVETDANHLVCHHAATSLLLRWGLAEAAIYQYPEIFALMKHPSEGPVSEDLQIHLSEAVIRLEQLRKRDDSGQSLFSLHIL